MKLFQKALADGRKALFSGSFRVMEKFGVKCVESYGIKPGDGVPEIKKLSWFSRWTAIGFCLKSDKRALILDIKNKEALELELKKLRKNFPDEHFVVQPMMERKTEIILGIKRTRFSVRLLSMDWEEYIQKSLRWWISWFCRQILTIKRMS